MARIVGVLLAAGRGARFGGDKLLASLPQRAGAESAVGLGVASAHALVAVLPGAVAVVRPADAALSAQLAAAGLRVVPCAHADDGMGASFACGVAASADADGWIVALADMPWISSSTIRAVADAVAAGAAIVAPRHRGRRGHPVGFSRVHRDALIALTGDAGARSIIDDHRDAVTWINVDDPGVLRDVDTRDDLRPPS